MKKKELARLRAYDDEQRDKPRPAKKPKVKKPYIVQCRSTNISADVESQFPWVKEWSRGQAFRSMEEAEKFKKRQERTQKHYKWCQMEYRIVDTTENTNVDESGNTKSIDEASVSSEGQSSVASG